MPTNKVVRFGPIALSATYTTNLLNPQTLTGGVNAPSGSNTYMVLRHIRVVNKTGAARTFRLYVGATGANAAGTEFMGIDKTVPANDAVDWYGTLRLDVSDFLVGGADAATSLVLQAEGEIGLA